MSRSMIWIGPATACLAFFVGVVGCQPGAPTQTPVAGRDPEVTPAVAEPDGVAAADEEHGHKAGAHGGIIVSLGRDSYHVEAIVDKDGSLRLYTLGNDESRVLDIEAQTFVAYVKPQGASESTPIDIRPEPQPGDATGKASLFVGELPKDAIGRAVDVTIPNVTIGGERFRLGFTTADAVEHGSSMPEATVGDAARELYLTPGGIYTEADIKANGGVTAAEKFRGKMATHDLKPAAGDKICPITLTKANPAFTWIVGGKPYEFCCPPCVDEFVAMAKENPEAIEPPEAYVKPSADEPSTK